MAKNQTSFKPGEGGRQAGSPNKLTKELRIILKEILSQEIILLHDQLDKLEPKDRLEILTKLLPFVMSKVNYEKENITIENGVKLPEWFNN